MEQAGDRDLDRQHLQALSILHYVLGGLVILLSCLPVLWMAAGIFFLISPPLPPKTAVAPGPPADFFAVIGWMYTLMGGGTALFLWGIAVLAILAGRYLARTQHWKFCLIAAGISCLFVPLGTILGIFTILVLLRPRVQRIFQGEEQPEPPPVSP